MSRRGLVDRIVAEVRTSGDAALRTWERRLNPDSPGLRVHPADAAAAWRAATPALRRALRVAHSHIVAMARWQRPRPWRRFIAPGVRVGQVIRPLESVGCYVPGGRFPLPSTVLMTAAVARVAGVPRIVVACPRPEPAVLAAAHLAGATEIYRMGGAQAIAALAYGTRSVKPVAKIVGPGNRYVTRAKQLVRADCEIDFAAGPSEILIVADRGARPDWVAADLLAQAEHDPDARAWLFTDSRALARAVRALTGSRAVVRVLPSLAAAIAEANRIAPEHLVVPRRLLPRVRHAGSVFLGEYSAVAAGDYATGPNHTLPTAGAARVRGGLSVADFVKVITVQELTSGGLRRLAPAVVTLAGCEGLRAHARSIQIRTAGMRP